WPPWLLRNGSPSGRSTLITSAPRSPSIMAASGAVMNEPNSTTRISESMVTPISPPLPVALFGACGERVRVRGSRKRRPVSGDDHVLLLPLTPTLSPSQKCDGERENQH